jgi:hypothetical protein
MSQPVTDEDTPTLQPPYEFAFVVAKNLQGMYELNGLNDGSTVRQATPNDVFSALLTVVHDLQAQRTGMTVAQMMGQMAAAAQQAHEAEQIRAKITGDAIVRDLSDKIKRRR